MKSPVASRPTQCPFCKTPGYAVEYRGPKGAAEKGLEQAEEQRVIMATLRMRQEEQAKAEERAKKREKDLSEGRVPDPPSPTLFPPPPPRMPAFPPAPTTQSPQSVNTPPQLRTQSPGSVSSDRGGADRGGSGGVRRRSSLNKRVSAIEPDNLWFRAGSSQGSASNSRRTSAIGQQEASGSSAAYSDFVQTLLTSTADSQTNAVATPGIARSSDENVEEGDGAPMPVLRAIARSGHEDMEVDLDDVMLNEAIWLSIQEEEERQRRSSQGGSTGAPNTEPAQTLTSDQTTPQTHLQTPSYEDPEEAAASELAKAIAASLEESATWRPAIGGLRGASRDGGASWQAASERGDGAGGSLDVGRSLSAPWPAASGWDTGSPNMGASYSGPNVVEFGARFDGQSSDGLGGVSESEVRTTPRQRLEDLLEFEAGGEVNSADRCPTPVSAVGSSRLGSDRKPEASGSDASRRSESKRTELVGSSGHSKGEPDPNSQRPILAWRSGGVAAVGQPELPEAEDGMQQGFEQGLAQGSVQCSEQGLEQGAALVQTFGRPNQDDVRTESLGAAHSGSGHLEGPVSKQTEGNGGSGTRVASSMAAPLGSETNALHVERLVDLSAAREGLDLNPFSGAGNQHAELSDETRLKERSQRLPMFAHLRSDSLYRSVERGEPHRGAAAESTGLVLSTNGAVGPLSLAQLAGRKAKTGPGSDEGTGTGKSVGEGVSVSKSIASGLEPTRLQFSVSDAPWAEKRGVSNLLTELGSVSGKPLEENSKTLAAKEGGGEKPAWRGLEKGETEVKSSGLGSGSLGSHGKGGRFSFDDAPWQDLMGKNGFASTNPFVGKQGEGALHVQPADSSASQGLGLATGYVEEAGFESKEKRDENKPLVNGKGIDGDLYPPLDDAPGVGLRETDRPSSSDARSRRTRSLSGSACCSLPSDRIEVAAFSPVKYPPPRVSGSRVGSDGFDTTKSVHRRSVSSNGTTCDTLGSSSERRPIGEGAARQRLSSDATFEEQMATAIALSLAETKADEQRRKEHEMFEKEAFCVTVETKPS